MKKINVLLATFFIVAWGAKAQTVTNLTVEQAIGIAKQNRPAYLLSDKDVAAAGYATKETRAGFTPKLTFDADLRYNTILATSIVPNFGSANPNEKKPVQFGTPWQSTAGITLKQSLLSPALKPGIQANEIREQLAQNAKSKSTTDLVEAVSTSYYQVLLSIAAVKYSTSSFSRWEALWKQLDLRQKEGRILSTEVNTAYINKENAKLTLQQDQQNVMLAKQYLLLQMGLDQVDPNSITLSDDLPGLYVPKDAESIDSMSLEARTEYKEARLNQSLAEVNAKKESKGILPTLNFVGYLGASGYGDKNNNIVDVSNNWFGNSYLGLQLSVPFLDLSRTNRVETQHINRDKALVQQKQWKAQIQYEIMQAELKTDQAVNAIEVRKKNLEVAQFNEKTIHDRFEEGRSLLTDVLDAENLLMQAEQQYLQSIYDYLIANLSLRKAMGKL